MMNEDKELLNNVNFKNIAIKKYIYSGNYSKIKGNKYDRSRKNFILKNIEIEKEILKKIKEIPEENNFIPKTIKNWFFIKLNSEEHLLMEKFENNLSELISQDIDLSVRNNIAVKIIKA